MVDADEGAALHARDDGPKAGRGLHPRRPLGDIVLHGIEIALPSGRAERLRELDRVARKSIEEDEGAGTQLEFWLPNLVRNWNKFWPTSQY